VSQRWKEKGKKSRGGGVVGKGAGRGGRKEEPRQWEKGGSGRYKVGDRGKKGLTKGGEGGKSNTESGGSQIAFGQKNRKREDRKA